MIKIEDLDWIPEEYYNWLKLTEDEENIYLEVQYSIDRASFAEFAGFVEKHGGYYESREKDSFFIIPKDRKKKRVIIPSAHEFRCPSCGQKLRAQKVVKRK